MQTRKVNEPPVWFRLLVTSMIGMVCGSLATGLAGIVVGATVWGGITIVGFLLWK